MPVVQRLREPSTWAAIAALLAVFGLPAGVPELVAQIGAAGAGLAGILIPEGRK